MLLTNSRFTSILIDEEAEKLSTGYKPKNAKKANKMGCGKL